MNTDDTTYQNAKLIKLGKLKPDLEFELLSKWTKSEWNSNLINGDIYFYEQMSNQVRLRLIFSDVGDIDRIPTLWNERLDTFGAKFKAILAENNIQKYAQYDFTKLDIDYFWFDDLYFEECIENIKTTAVREEFSQYNLWGIYIFFTQIIVFYPTNNDINKYKASGVTKQIELRITSMFLANDQFNILQNRTLNIKFDSKENFDKIGGWYDYHR
jgi:hypothetical protein